MLNLLTTRNIFTEPMSTISIVPVLHSCIVTVSTVTAWWLCCEFWTNVACLFNGLLNGLNKFLPFFITEAHSKAYQIYKTELVSKIFYDNQAFAIFTKNVILDVWLGSEYASVIHSCLNWPHFPNFLCISIVGYKYIFHLVGWINGGNLLLNSIFDFNATEKKLYGPFLLMSFNSLKATKPIRGGSLIFTIKFPEIPDAHLIYLGRAKGWVSKVINDWS